MSDKPSAPKPPSAPASTGLTANAWEMVFLVLFLTFLGGAIGVVNAFFSGGALGVSDFLARLYAWATTLATIVAMVAVAIAIYSFMRISELMSEETKKLGLALNWNTERTQKNERWERVESYMASLNPSDWKIGILEADNILDQVVERMGYPGNSLGERMKHIEASDFPYLEEAWTAHKTRNAIAHKGTDYELTRSEAEQTINIYHRIFKELGYL